MKKSKRQLKKIRQNIEITTVSNKNDKHKSFDVETIKEFIKNSSKDSKIYFGCDSTRFVKKNKLTNEKTWFAKYAEVIVIHYDGKHGCKVFGQISVERDFDNKPSKPKTRMLMEVQKISELFSKFEDVLENRSVEIHLDINSNDSFGSNCAMNDALGMIRNMYGFDPKFKPDAAWAASYCADWLLKN